ncbi:unnamed protein product [Caenorhabditis nigoni]
MSFYYSAPSFYSFHYVPRTNRLNHDQKKSLDNYSRYMAEKMIEIQDQYYYDSQLTEYPVYKKADGTKPTQSISPTGAKLIPNPFYNPELAKQLMSKKSMSKN